MKQKICMVGIASGLALGNLGFTHCCIEDIGILRTIPGNLGGAVKMNAGCYGSYLSDYLIGITLIKRDKYRMVVYLVLVSVIVLKKITWR